MISGSKKFQKILLFLPINRTNEIATPNHPNPKREPQRKTPKSFYFFLLNRAIETENSVTSKPKDHLQGQETLKSNAAIPLHLFVALLLVILSKSQAFNFFCFVQQWPGSSCDTKQGCCYPTSGKPTADFGIRGLWPNNNNGSSPSNCNPNSPFNPSQELRREMQAKWPILACPSSNGLNLWSYEWKKQGTCSESVLSQHAYFQAALNLKKQANLPQKLKNAGIKPDGRFYSLSNISEAIRMATGYQPGIQCHVDKGRNLQLYRIYQCVDTSGSKFIDCPGMPLFRCASKIKFPSF